jgi:hypothetical protein
MIMTSITASNTLITELGDLKHWTEIRKPDGAVLGYFAPADKSTDALYQEAREQIDPAEIQRRKRAPDKGFSIEEVLAHLRSLESEACPGP